MAELIERRDFPGLQAALRACPAEELRRLWTSAAPLEKLAAFKLLDPRAALDFYETLDFTDRYLVCSGFDHGSIAPLIEGNDRAKALLHRLPEGSYDAMLRGLEAAG